MLELEDLKCPNCGSRKILSDEEYRFCCIFKHGDKTLDELPDYVIKGQLLTLKIEFYCEDCGTYFYVVYKPTEIKKTLSF